MCLYTELGAWAVPRATIWRGAPCRDSGVGGGAALAACVPRRARVGRNEGQHQGTYVVWIGDSYEHQTDVQVSNLPPPRTATPASIDLAKSQERSCGGSADLHTPATSLESEGLVPGKRGKDPMAAEQITLSPYQPCVSRAKPLFGWASTPNEIRSCIISSVHHPQQLFVEPTSPRPSMPDPLSRGTADTEKARASYPRQ